MSLLPYERGMSILSVPSQMSNCHIHDNNYIYYTSVYLVYIYTCVKCLQRSSQMTNFHIHVHYNDYIHLTSVYLAHISMCQMFTTF